MAKWLLICHLLLLVMKILLSVIYNIRRDTNCSAKTNNVVGFTFYFILYPILIIWNIIGNLWFVQIQEDPRPKCVSILFTILEILCLRYILGNYILAYYQLFFHFRLSNNFNCLFDRMDKER